MQPHWLLIWFDFVNLKLLWNLWKWHKLVVRIIGVSETWPLFLDNFVFICDHFKAWVVLNILKANKGLDLERKHVAYLGQSTRRSCSAARPCRRPSWTSTWRWRPRLSCTRRCRRPSRRSWRVDSPARSVALTGVAAIGVTRGVPLEIKLFAFVRKPWKVIRMTYEKLQKVIRMAPKLRAYTSKRPIRYTPVWRSWRKKWCSFSAVIVRAIVKSSVEQRKSFL